MYIDEKDEKIIITSYFLKDSPAEKAGLKEGDQIISINNFPTKGLNIE